MKERITVTLDSEWLQDLDEARGEISRSKYIEKIIRQHFAPSEVIASSKEKVPATFTVEEFRAIVQEVNRKLMRLELMEQQLLLPTTGAGAQLQQVKSVQESMMDVTEQWAVAGEDIEGDKRARLQIEPEREVRETQQSEQTKIFRFPDEHPIYEYVDQSRYGAEPPTYVDKVVTEPVKAVELEQVREATRDADAEGEQYEFEYGCPSCGNTVDAFDIKCGACGKSFEEVYTTPEGDTKVYTYRDLKLKSKDSSYDFHTISSQKLGDHTEENAPVCVYCKRPLYYILQYQRWYCYLCKRYAEWTELSKMQDTPVPPPPQVSGHQYGSWDSRKQYPVGQGAPYIELDPRQERRDFYNYSGEVEKGYKRRSSFWARLFS
jgi:ribosomal protein L37AE/L43A